MKIEAKQLQKLLNETRPQTLAKPLVRRARRMLWVLLAPILRYLFAQSGNSVRNLTGLVHGVRDGAAQKAIELEARIVAQQAELAHLAGLYQSLVGELPKFVQPIIDFRTESAALMNRGAVLESDMLKLSAQVEALVESNGLLADVQDVRHGNLVGTVADIGQALSGRLEAAMAAVEDGRRMDAAAIDNLHNALVLHREAADAAERRVADALVLLSAAVDDRDDGQKAMTVDQTEAISALEARLAALEGEVEPRALSADSMTALKEELEALKADLADLRELEADRRHEFAQEKSELRFVGDELREGLARIADGEALLASAGSSQAEALASRLDDLERDLRSIDVEYRQRLAAKAQASVVEDMVDELVSLKTRLALVSGPEIDRRLEVAAERAERRLVTVEEELRGGLARIADGQASLAAAAAGARQADALRVRLDDLERALQASEADFRQRLAAKAQAEAVVELLHELAGLKTRLALVSGPEVDRKLELAAERAERRLVTLEDDLRAGLARVAEGERLAAKAQAAAVEEIANEIATLSARLALAKGPEFDRRIELVQERVDRRLVTIETDLRDGMARIADKASKAIALGDAASTALAEVSRDLAAAIGQADVGPVRQALVELRDESSSSVEALRTSSEVAVQQLNEKLDRLEGAIGWVSERTNEARRRSRLFLSMNRESLTLLRADDLISETVVEHGEWDAHVVELMDRVAESKNGIAIDVGAHFGLMSIAMAQRFDRVVSFEPNDFHFRMLVANIALNGLDNVECRNHPLFSSDVVLSLGKPEQQETPLPLTAEGHFDPMEAENSASFMFTQDGLADYQHRACTLDSLELEGVAFIKIDVQGGDGEVIMGARQTLKRCRPVIVFEWEQILAGNFSVDLDMVKSELRKLNYSLRVLKQHSPKQIDYIAYPREVEI